MRANKSTLFAIIVAAAVGCDAPGEGPKADRWYERAKPVIAGLDSFRVVRGQYPDSLSQLVPEFLAVHALEVPAATQEHYPLEYEGLGDNYKLTFRYVGPGMNRCSIEGTRRTWACRGDY